MKIGDMVVTMGMPGRFKVVAIDGEAVTIDNGEGIRKTVRIVNLRVLSEAISS